MSAEGWEQCPCGFSHRIGDPSPLHSAEWLAAQNVRLTALLMRCERLLFRWRWAPEPHEGEAPVSVATAAYFAPKGEPDQGARHGRREGAISGGGRPNGS